MRSVTCVVHGGEVDVSDTVELPNGPVCTRCYVWMEDIMSEEDDEEYEIEIVFTPEEDDDDDF